MAELYGVETKRINEAVSNNPEKFPEGYVLMLDNQEKAELVENFDWFNRQKHSTSIPKAFTEKGLYMLATILKSPRGADHHRHCGGLCQIEGIVAGDGGDSPATRR